MDWKKLIPSLLPILAIVVDQFSGQITSWLSSHPTAALLAATAVTVVANVLNPHKPDPPQP